MSPLQKMPLLFVGHGSPHHAIEENNFTLSLKDIAKKIPLPKAILIISAHWETNGTFITGMKKPKTIHDFYGFPKELYDLDYPVDGNPDLASSIAHRVLDPKISIEYTNWGLDHGSWSILTHLYPQANIPTLQLSLDKTKSLSFHFELGKKLKYLRSEGVLIIASGNIVHNLKKAHWEQNAIAHNWAIEFDEWTKSMLLSRNFSSLINKPIHTSAGKLSIPTFEHYLPLLYILGAYDQTDQLNFDYEAIELSSISMRSFRFY